MSKVAPFGSWASPISIDLVLKGQPVLTMPRWDGGDLYWIERRPLERGRQVVVQHAAGGAVSDITPAGFNARTSVHEYGGGEYAVHRGTVWFANFDDQRLYRQDPGKAPTAITPGSDLRHADLLVDARRGRIIAVREDHTAAGREAANSLVALDCDGKREAETLVAGNDFYSSPTLSHDGDRLAWLTWNHPNMPWDGTELWVGELDAAGRLRSSRHIAGGAAESIYQPEWSPDGELYFASDRSGWWNLYRAAGEGAEPVCPRAAEFGAPQWTLGMRHYAVVGADEIMCLFSHEGVSKLARLDPRTQMLTPVDLLYTKLEALAAGGRKVAMVAASPTLSQRLLTVDLDSHGQEVVRASGEPHIDPGYMSLPQSFEFPTDAGVSAQALHYAPRNRDFESPPGMKPPLLVHCHGGPTSSATSAFNLEMQYWASRGFAVVDVNYRGSAGRGRAYRDSLKGRWGEADVADCINAARHLVRMGHADPERVAITGGSAGGFTALLALTKHDFFRAGASHFGVADLVSFRAVTHKFESRYLESLIGPYPQRADLYRERSAVNFVDRLRCPVILFQGLNDRVVPASQAEGFVAACRANKLPYAYLAFAGEQHGFRQAANIRRSIEAEFYFYSRIFGFRPADEIEPVVVENL